MHLSWAAATDRGMRRPDNEDSYCARPDLGLFVIADGMGGHAAGDVASRVAVDAIAAYVAETPPDASTPPDERDPAREDMASRLRGAFLHANRQLGAESVLHRDLRGMATTASAVLVAGNEAALAHVGDSRVYLLRAEHLRQLTTDHSWVQEQVDAGRLSRAEARTHGWRNIVTRALSGGDDDPEIDMVVLGLETGDSVLLCSDGLFVVVPDDTIREILVSAASLEAACQALIDAANRNGGPDNVTALILHVDAA